MSKITTTLLKKIFTGTPNAKLQRFVEPMNSILPKYGINDKKRFAAFIANVAIESDRLKTTKEYGSEGYFKRYDGRKDLGNIRDDDGPRYRGRSVLQTTGRWNYWRVVVAYLRVITGKNWDNKLAYSNFDAYLKSKDYDNLLKEANKHNVNFLENPELLEQFPHAVEAAGVFVKDNNLNSYADKGQFYGYAGVLNRGSARKKALHYNDRLAYYEKAMEVIPDDFSLTEGIFKKTVSSQPSEEGNNSITVENAENVKITEAGASEESTNVKVSVQDGNIEVETNTPTQPTEKVAVVATKPPGVLNRIYTKVAAALTGNVIVTTIVNNIQSMTGIAVSPTVVVVVIGLIILFTLIWLGYEIYKREKEKDRQKELDTLLVQQNSTPTNIVQIVSPEDAALFAAKGWRIVNRGDEVQDKTGLKADKPVKEEE